jgi:hypothetical protein
MNDDEAVVRRETYSTRFKNEDLEYFSNYAIGVGQIIGMSASQEFLAIYDIKDGDLAGWREDFRREGQYQIERAKEFFENKHNVAAGQFYTGAANAFRAALQFRGPQSG